MTTYVSADPSPSPSQPRRSTRLLGVDAARGVALIAMMAVHLLPGFDADGGVSLSHEIARGRAAPAFAVLAGVALALAYGGPDPRRGRGWVAAAAGLLVRCVCIAAIGFALGSLGSGLAIILANYALLFVLAIPLLRLRAPTLAAIAVVVAVVAPVQSHLVRADLAPLRGPSPVFADLAEPTTLLAELTLTGYYPAFAWVAYLAAGLAVGRLDLARPLVARALLLGGAGLAVAAITASQVLLDRPEARASLPAGAADQIRHGTTPPTTWWWLAIAQPHSSTPIDLAHTIGTALALLGACLLLGAAVGRRIAPLAAVGSMTLTLYTLHVLAVAGTPDPEHPWAVWAIQVAFAFVIATQWRPWSRRGPVEQLVSWPARRAVGAVLSTGR